MNNIPELIERLQSAAKMYNVFDKNNNFLNEAADALESMQKKLKERKNWLSLMTAGKMEVERLWALERTHWENELIEERKRKYKLHTRIKELEEEVRELNTALAWTESDE